MNPRATILTQENEQFLLIAEPNSYRISAFLSAATQMGLEVMIASCGQFSLISEVHDGIHIDLTDHETSLHTLFQESRIRPFVGVIGIDDSTVELAARVALKIGLPHNPPDAARLTRRKDLARGHLAKAHCRVPRHWLINLAQTLDQQIYNIEFPCVVKPLALSASRGVIRSNNKTELITACKRIQPMLSEVRDSFESRHLLVESYIPGIEVAYEGFLRHGKLTSLVIFDKPDPLTGPYFEETIYVTPSNLPTNLQSIVKEQVAMACAAYGLTTGPIHAELRINESEAWILEVAARTIGGDCARCLDVDNGYSLEELAICLAIDRPTELTPPNDARGVMMIPIKERGILRRVEGISNAIQVAHIENIEITSRTGNDLVPLPEGNQYPGFIFARAHTPAEVIAALREAYGKLKFVVAPVFNTRLG